jgi:type III secretory pathway component EscT
MVLFLIGLIVGGIFGITLLAVLSSGAIADEQMEHMMKESVNSIIDKQNVIIHKN